MDMQTRNSMSFHSDSAIQPATGYHDVLLILICLYLYAYAYILILILIRVPLNVRIICIHRRCQWLYC